jgi:hypothetical protein
MLENLVCGLGVGGVGYFWRGNDISLFEMARMNYLRVQQNALLEPEEMIRRAPPFENSPFLYDNRQTVPHASTSKRFAVVVFKNGVQDSRLIPIDLPASPDCAVKHVGLAIDLCVGLRASSTGGEGDLCERCGRPCDWNEGKLVHRKLPRRRDWQNRFASAQVASSIASAVYIP